MKIKNNKFYNLPLWGSIISALIASLCCIGPVILALLGMAGAGLLSKFSIFRPYFIGITSVFLGAAFYLTYRKRKVRCEDGSCKIRSAGKWNKMALWGATVLIVSFFAFPYLLNLSNPNPAKNLSKEEISEAIIPVEGMTCTGCEFNVESAIKKLDGIVEVKANHKEGKVYLKFKEGKVDLAKVVEKINKTGYRAIKQPTRGEE